jgi:hypothetical protein
MAQAQQLLRHTLPQAILRVISSSQDIKSGSSQDTQSQTLYSIIEYISELICMEAESGAREVRHSDPVQLELLNEHTTEVLGSDSIVRQLLSAFARLYAKTDLQPWWLTRQYTQTATVYARFVRRVASLIFMESEVEIGEFERETDSDTDERCSKTFDGESDVEDGRSDSDTEESDKESIRDVSDVR